MQTGDGADALTVDSLGMVTIGHLDPLSQDLTLANGAARMLSILPSNSYHDTHLTLKAADSSRNGWRAGDLRLYAGGNTNGSSGSGLSGDVFIQPGYTASAASSASVGRMRFPPVELESEPSISCHPM